MAQVVCCVCGLHQQVPRSRAARYKTCSRKCMAKMYSEERSENVTASCLICQKEFPTKTSHLGRRKTCSKECFAKLKAEQMTGEGNHQSGKFGSARGLAYKGGRCITYYGYVKVLKECGSYDFEHRVVMESIIGRPLLTNEQVHHINEDRQDNRPENLQLMTKAEHASLHCHKNPQPRDGRSQQFISRKIAA